MVTQELRRGLPLILICAVIAMAITAHLTLGERPEQTVAIIQQTMFPTPVGVTTTAPHVPASSPTAIYPGTYTGTPTPNPTFIVTVSAHGGIETYIVQPGETLSLIAALFGCTVEEIVAANNLPDANSIGVGQVLTIPITATEAGPYLKLIPDSEAVYGPAYVAFDPNTFVAKHGGYLARYTQEVEGRLLSGAEIVQLVARRFSVGPRVLLTLLELRSGWVTQPQPAAETLASPLGCAQSCQAGLFSQLSWAAVRLNEGYYGWKYGKHTTARLANGVRAAFAPGLNPGTAGVQNCLAGLSATWDEWLALTGQDGFLATYARLFGNPFAYAVDPLVPPDLTQPELWLPWEAGKTWYFTGGPHGGWWNDGNDAALDFVPSDKIPDCRASRDWVTAAAPGLVLRSEDGEVLLDLDGDGFEQTGWVLFYLHIGGEDRVQPGVYLQRGQPIGHPSCEGGFADASHLHLARRYNGEWIPAGRGPLPMVLSGWTAHDGAVSYDGTLTRGDEVRTACECWDSAVNGLLSDNEP